MAPEAAPEQESAPQARREAPSSGRNRVGAAAGAVAFIAVLWLAGPRRPAGPPPVALEPAASAAKPVPIAEPATDETAGLKPYDPKTMDCGRVPRTPMPGARLLGRGGRATATIMPSEAAANHSIYYGTQLLGTSQGATGQAPFDLGPIAFGQELKLSIRVHGPGGALYRAGPGARNGDRHVHAAVTSIGVDVWKVGFEDLEGGGDGDFNDAIVVIRGELAAETPSGDLKCGLPPKGSR